MSQKRIALVVGIGNYQNTNKLEYCPPSAEAVYELLIDSKYGGCDKDLSILRSVSKIEDQFKKTDFIELVDEISERIEGRKDQFVFYFSGHAEVIENAFVLMVSNSVSGKLISSLNFSYITDAIHHKTSKAIFIVDACHSGAMTESVKNMQGDWQEARVRLPKGFGFMSSCSKEDVSVQVPEFQKTLFAHYFVQGIKNWDKSQEWIVLPKLKDYINREAGKIGKTQVSKILLVEEEEELWFMKNPKYLDYIQELALENQRKEQAKKQKKLEEETLKKEANEKELRITIQKELKKNPKLDRNQVTYLRDIGEDLGIKYLRIKDLIEEEKTGQVQAGEQTFLSVHKIELPVDNKSNSSIMLEENIEKSNSKTEEPKDKPSSDSTQARMPVLPPKIFTNSIGMEFVYIPPGEFMMGASPNDTDAYDNEKPAHKVKISKGFYMGKYPVTQEEWRKVMGSDPKELKFKGKDKNPVENVSWNDVQEFLKKLNEKQATSRDVAFEKYRLPTEAEWEYAARAGTTTKYFWGDEMDDSKAWYEKNSGGSTKPVGAEGHDNPYGLYDMLGNVWEWCEDWYDGKFYEKSMVGSQTFLSVQTKKEEKMIADPFNNTDDKYKVIRGGSWYIVPRAMRVSHRFSKRPDVRIFHVGFRVVLPLSGSL